MNCNGCFGFKLEQEECANKGDKTSPRFDVFCTVLDNRQIKSNLELNETFYVQSPCDCPLAVRIFDFPP